MFISKKIIFPLKNHINEKNKINFKNLDLTF